MAGACGLTPSSESIVGNAEAECAEGTPSEQLIITSRGTEDAESSQENELEPETTAEGGDSDEAQDESDLPSTGWPALDRNIDRLSYDAQAARYACLGGQWLKPFDAAGRRLAALMEDFKDPQVMRDQLKKDGWHDTADDTMLDAMTFWLTAHDAA